MCTLFLHPQDNMQLNTETILICNNFISTITHVTGGICNLHLPRRVSAKADTAQFSRVRKGLKQNIRYLIDAYIALTAEDYQFFAFL